jgi:hypothetical protein
MNLNYLYNIHKWPECLPVYMLKNLDTFHSSWYAYSGFTFNIYETEVENNNTYLVLKHKDWLKYNE